MQKLSNKTICLGVFNSYVNDGYIQLFKTMIDDTTEYRVVEVDKRGSQIYEVSVPLLSTAAACMKNRIELLSQ